MRLFNVDAIIEEIRTHFPSETDAIARLEDLKAKVTDQISCICDENFLAYTIAKKES